MDFENITELDLSNKGLNELPDLSKYTNLKKLGCSYNKLFALNNLPPGLQILCCEDNTIVRLDNLPPGLKELYCNHNKLIALDNLPPGLEILYCDNNPLIYNFEPTLENIRNSNSRI